MDIKGAALFQEMQTYAKQARSLSNEMQPTHLQAENVSKQDFSDLFKRALDNVNALQKNTNELITAVEMGDPKVSLAQAMIAGQKSSIAFDATVQVRNRLVEAYKEVMAMPV